MPVSEHEETYPPVKGGAVEAARKEIAKLESMAHVAAEQEAAKPVKPKNIVVKIRQPDLFGAKTVTIGAGVSTLGLPAEPNRKRGIVNLITDTSTVLIARDRSGADSGTGYILSSGNPPLEFEHTREVWLHNSGGSSIQVSIYSESYDSL